MERTRNKYEINSEQREGMRTPDEHLDPNLRQRRYSQPAPKPQT